MKEEEGLQESVDTREELNNNNSLKPRKPSKFYLTRLVVIICAFFFACYLTYGIFYVNSNNLPWQWCKGLGFVLIVTGLSIFWIVCKLLLQLPGIGTRVDDAIDRAEALIQCLCKVTPIKIALHTCVYVGIFIYLLIDAWEEPERLISIAGLVFLLIVAIAFSKHPRHISWRVVTWGLALQFTLALICLRWESGRSAIDCLSKKVEDFLAYSQYGTAIGYDYLVTRKPFLLGLLNNESIAYNVAKEINDKQAIPGITFFTALPVLYFFSFILNMLFYFGWIQAMTKNIGKLLEKSMGTTLCESTNAAANIFLGHDLAPLVIKPYVKILTLSEVHAIIASGFATIAGNVFALYVSLGIDASFLLAASVMSAPAALACAKILYPETQISKTSSKTMPDMSEASSEMSPDHNVIDAAIRGAVDASIMVRDIMAILVAMIAFVAFLNGTVSFFGNIVGHGEITFESLIGKCFIPLAWMMGVKWSECETIGRLLGTKFILNEFISYSELGQLAAECKLSGRSVAIASYAMCGFANPGSVGITMAVLCNICPERRSDFSSVIFRAFLAAAIGCLLTGCFAGALYQESSHTTCS